MKNGEDTVVLVIDNDSVVRESIASYLSNNNYRVVQAASSEAGINAFHSSSPALVIYDINIPDNSGFDAISTIFAQSPIQPIIILSDQENTDDIIRAMRLGVSDYLLKPLNDMEMLMISIENSLNRSRLIAQNNLYRKNLEEINQELEERIEVFQMDQQAGRQVQMRMLPVPPQDLNNFHFDHRVIPSLYLSGDSVDYQPITKSQVLFYIGDVSGHGSSSAFVTVLLRFRIAQMRREYIRGRFAGEFTPAHIMELLNRDLLDTGLEKHITVCMGILDNKDNTLLYSIAGHHPLPVIYQNGKAVFLEPAKRSFPIGLVAEAEYFNEKISLSDDFALFLFSDGILEYLPGKDMAEKEARIIDVISKCKGDFKQVKTGLHLHRDIKVPDDIAVLSATGL
ncbi:fused response regulator/phosphatase [Gammaproteobacteria bacterium]|nr:fused response regulator/phosphatase [Gammaproteobacteria bacterium]